jgi:hypothetical protein
MACHDPQGIDCQTPEAIQKTESESWLLSTLRTKPKTVSLIVFFKNSDQVIVRTNTENLRITTLGDTDKNAIQSAATSAGVSWTVNSGYSSNDWTFYFWALGIGLMLGAILTRQAFLRQLKKAGIVPNEFGELPKGQGGFNRSDPTNGMDKHRAQVFEPDQLDGPKLEQFIGQEEAVDQVMGILPFLKEESREKPSWIRLLGTKAGMLSPSSNAPAERLFVSVWCPGVILSDMSHTTKSSRRR